MVCPPVREIITRYMRTKHGITITIAFVSCSPGILVCYDIKGIGHRLGDSYTMGCPSVRGDKPRV